VVKQMSRKRLMMRRMMKRLSTYTSSDRWDWWKQDTGRSDNSSIQCTTQLCCLQGLDVGTPLGWTVKDDAPA
jgi:hypothetical protein